MQSRGGAGALQGAGSEGLDRAERARGSHSLRRRLAGRPGENLRGERVGVPAGQAHRGQRLAAHVTRHCHHVRADGLRRAGLGPSALNPEGQSVQGLAHPRQAVQ